MSKNVQNQTFSQKYPHALTQAEINQQVTELNGKELKVYLELSRGTGGGRRWYRAAAHVIASNVDCTVRWVREILKKFAIIGLVAVRHRFMLIGGIMKQLANEYRLLKPIETRIVAEVKKLTGGFLAYAAKRKGELGFTVAQPKSFSDDIFNRDRPKGSALEQFYARNPKHRPLALKC